MRVEDNRKNAEIKRLRDIEVGECFEFDGIFGGINIKTDSETVKEGIKFVKCVNVKNGWLCSYREDAPVSAVNVKVVIDK